MPNRDKPYLFAEFTLSLCSHCAAKVPAKIIVEDNAVYLLKQCLEHGQHRELLEEDATYYLARNTYNKPGTLSKTQTEIRHGCPNDCGLCPDHEQHTCIGVLEVTSACDLHCPVCYASSTNGTPRPLDTIERMMDMYQDSEHGAAEILQISGGEPTTHPRILDILAMAKAKRFRYVMLNTNGLRIAQDPDFARELAQFKGGFEIYLQFDGFEAATYQRMRGRDLSALKQQAIDNLTAYKVPITLVATVQRGVNEQEVGHIVQHGLTTTGVRGVNFQPVAFFGRYAEADRQQRITLTGILQRLEQQTQGMIRRDDYIPLPCNVDRVAIAYLYRNGETFTPLTRNAKIKDYLPFINNTLAFDAADILTQTAQGLLSGQNVCKCLSFLKDFLPVAPVGRNLHLRDGKIAYAIENTFRISVTSFIDQYNFDMRSMKKECVHILTPDLRKIPFSAYNMCYREDYAYKP